MKLLLLLNLVVVAYCDHARTYVNFFGPNAIIDMQPGADQVSGRLELYKKPVGVFIQGFIQGLSPGIHGFHVHEKGDLSDMCKAAGGHFNPLKTNHGAPFDFFLRRHVGDLGNIEADGYGVANISIYDRLISLNPFDLGYIGNLAVVVHQGNDDLGRGGNEGSLKTGNAGGRAGCGLIQLHY